jgi:hypothetical protein
MSVAGLVKAERWVVDDEQRLNDLIDQQEARIATIFRTAVEQLKDELDVGELADLIQQGRIHEAIDRLQYAAEQLGSASNVAFVASGNSTADFLSEAGVARIVFDQVNYQAIAMMQRNRLELIREFTSEQRRATSLALVSGVEAGTNPRAAARNFRDSIGLTTNQWGHVASYRAALGRVGLEAGYGLTEADLRRAGIGSPTSDVLNRKLRDGRFDRTILAAARKKQPLGAEKIDQMVARYTARYVKHRAEVIGRTEAMRAVNQANEEAYRQAIERGDIRPEQLRREWRTRLDGRERRTHRYLNGIVNGWGEPWITENGAIKYPGDPDAPAVETIQCRCALLTRIQQL